MHISIGVCVWHILYSTHSWMMISFDGQFYHIGIDETPSYGYRCIKHILATYRFHGLAITWDIQFDAPSTHKIHVSDRSQVIFFLLSLTTIMN